MKNFRSLIATLVCVLLFGSTLYAQAEINDAERMAQKSMMEYLRSKGFAPTIDKADQSVNFKKSNVLYWITFDGNASTMLFTLHRKPIKFTMDKDGQNKVNQKRELALYAANKITATNQYKAFLNGSRVEFIYPIYAKSADEYQTVFPKVLNAMSNIRESFDRNYKAAKLVVDSIHNYWANVDTAHVVLEQKTIANDIKAQRNLTITGISVRNVSSNGYVLSDYDEGIRKSKCQYIQEKIDLKATKSGMYKIGLQIVNPKGKILIPHKGATYTTVTTIDVPKANKEIEVELLRFGTDAPDFWQPGEYKIYLFEDDNVIYDDAFNVL